MNKFTNNSCLGENNIACWSESSESHASEQVYDIYTEPSVLTGKPMKMNNVATVNNNNNNSTVNNNNNNNSQQTTTSSRYAILRDADSTVLDYGYDSNGVFQARMTVRPQVHLENKTRHQNIDSDVKPISNRTLRPHSTPATLLWLEENYEIAEGVCIPRSALYMHYVDFCARNCIQPVNAASFGKIIRQQFPQLTTRRLGTRGQSRYHYYGIAVRENSSYYQLAYSKKAITSNNLPDSSRSENLQGSKNSPQPIPDQVNSTRNRMGTVLPDFPSPNDFKLPSNLDTVKISTFLMMYRTHCQRILDTVIRANFDEIQTFVLYFWQGIPPHLTSILSSNAFINLIGICDSILYKCMASVLLPSALQTFSDSLTKVIRKFIQEFECWLKTSLYNLPEPLKSMKIDLSRRIGNLLRRQTSISHLIQAARMVVNNVDVTPQMIQDWKTISTENLIREISSGLHKTEANSINNDIIRTALRDFGRLLEEESPIEAYFDWLNSLVQYCIINPSKNLRFPLKDNCKQFLYTWSAFASRIIRDLSIHTAPSFGSFHLLRLLFDEYLWYIMEYCQIDEYIVELMGNVNRDLPPRPLEDYLLGEFCDESAESYQTNTGCNINDQSQSSPSLNPGVRQDGKILPDGIERASSVAESYGYTSADYYQVQGYISMHDGHTSSSHMITESNRKNNFGCSYSGDYQGQADQHDYSLNSLANEANYSRFVAATVTIGQADPNDQSLQTVANESTAQPISSSIASTMNEEAIFSVCTNLKTEIYPEFC